MIEGIFSDEGTFVDKNNDFQTVRVEVTLLEVILILRGNADRNPSVG